MPRAALAMFIGLVLVHRSDCETPPAESLREFVVKNKSRHAVGVYLQGKKVGYLVTEFGLQQYQGKEAAAETSEMLLSLAVEGEKTVARHREKVIYALEGEGPIVFAEQVETHDDKETVHTAVPADKGLDITTKVGESVTKRSVPLPKSNLDQARRMTRWLSAGPKPGDTFEHWGTEWDKPKVDSREVFTYLGKSTIVWGGVKTDIYRVKADLKGAIFEGEVLANGNPIRGKLAVFEMRAENEEVAKKLDEGTVDMIAASSIKVDRHLGNSKTVTALTLEVDGLKDFKLPESHRQRLRREGGRTLLDLKADSRVDRATPLTDEERSLYTAATPTIQCDDEKVKKLAAEIVGAEEDPLKRADKIKSWVYRKLRKSMASNSSTTRGVLDAMAGDCTEHTLLFVSLARAAGLPAREVTGVAHVDKIFGWHAWAEVHDGRQWVSVDPTWDELYVDATHIVFSHDTEDNSWLNVLGNVSFKVVKVEKKK